MARGVSGATGAGPRGRAGERGPTGATGPLRTVQSSVLSWVALAVVALALGGLFVAIAVHASQDRHRQDRAAVATCERQNVLRARQNLNSEALYWVITRDRAAGNHALSSALAWTPLVNCHLAVTDPTRYRPPVSVPFTVAPPPPADLPGD